jgi:hypothetical protein
MATYNRGQPESGQEFRDSRPLIADNFDAADDAISNDHVSFTDSTVLNRALHKKVTFSQVQGSDPNLNYPQSQIYTKSDGATSQILYWDRVDTSNNDVITPISPLGMVKFGAAGANGVVIPSKTVNITVVKNADGNYSLTLTNAAPDANYIPIASMRYNVPNLSLSININSSSSFDILVRNTTSPYTLTNPSDIYCVVWGF